MSEWFENFMVRSQDKFYDVMHVFDFVLFSEYEGAALMPETLEERREALERGLGYLDELAQAGFPTWEIYAGNDVFRDATAEEAIARWREQIVEAADPDSWRSMQMDALINGPFLYVMGEHHPLRAARTSAD